LDERSTNTRPFGVGMREGTGGDQVRIKGPDRLGRGEKGGIMTWGKLSSLYTA